MNPQRSGLREDLFGAKSGNALRDSLATQGAIDSNLVRRRPLDVATRVGDRDPFDFKDVTGEATDSALNGPGDDPLHRVPRISVGDDDGTRVLDPAGISPVHDVRSDDPLAVIETVSGESAHGQSAGTERDQDDDGYGEFPKQSAHHSDGSDNWRIPRWAKVLIAGLIIVFISAMAFAILQPVQVLPRIRLSPGYALTSDTGATITSEDGRGTITLYTFVPEGCGHECAEINQTISEVTSRVDATVDLAGTEFRTVTMVMGADATGAAATRDLAMEATGEWLAVNGADLENVVGLGFGRPTQPDEFSPAFAIVDGWGMIRGEYRYSTLADDADKLVRHIDVLGSELRNDHGFASFVYEAAHAFQCYP